MRCGAGFNDDKARSLPLKELEPGCASTAGEQPLDPTHQRHVPKDVLREIEPDRGNFVHSTAPPLMVPQQQPQFGTSMPVAGAVHSIKSSLGFLPPGLGRFQRRGELT
jgi:hypothetical protein